MYNRLEHAGALNDDRMRGVDQQQQLVRLLAARRARRRADRAACRARKLSREATTQAALANSSLW